MTKLDPKWITGFVDGEGCFFVGINKHPEMTAGYQVLPEFVVVQHKNDVQILYALKNYFKCGVIRVSFENHMAYRVRGIKHITDVIIPFFEKNDLKTKKKVDFLKFRKIIQLINKKEHLSKEGIEKIKEIAFQMNTKSRKV